MFIQLVSVLALMFVAACAQVEPEPDSGPDLKATAEDFFRSVYGCSPSGIDGRANPAVKISYPIFEALYGTQVIRGVPAVKDFSASFCQRWTDASITIYAAINEGASVVLVWSFSATDRRAEDSTESRQSWGGMSFFRFDDMGRVVEEFGEESSPGPAARMMSGEGR